MNTSNMAKSLFKPFPSNQSATKAQSFPRKSSNTKSPMIARHAKDFTWNRGCSSNSPPLKHGDQIPHPLEDSDLTDTLFWINLDLKNCFLAIFDFKTMYEVKAYLNPAQFWSSTIYSKSSSLLEFYLKHFCSSVSSASLASESHLQGVHAVA